MAKSIRANLELASERAVRTIMSKDAPELTSDAKAFAEANLLTYYVAINTWLLIVKQWSEYGWAYLLRSMEARGLIPVIREFSEAADQIVHGEVCDSEIVRMIWRDVQATPMMGHMPTTPNRTFHTDPMSTILLICRYLKRFSPLRCDKLQDRALDGFVAIQRRLKKDMRTGYSTFILSRVKYVVSQMLDWDKLCSELESVDVSDVVFTPGVSFDTNARLVSKLSRMTQRCVEYFPQPMGVPLVANPLRDWEPEPRWGRSMEWEKHTVRLIPVPKNFKTARVIAPEDVYRQARARRYFQICDRYLPAQINLHDQSQNQNLAMEGSISGQVATIDLSSASDSVTRALLASVFPNRFMRLLDGILPTHYELRDHTFQLHSAATMGNSMTFWLESVVFFAITQAASDFVGLFAPVSGTISVYGDDIECDTTAAVTVIEWLEALGFSVNEEKSYYDPDHRYRESCGEEYFEGRCVSSAYYPRFPLQGKLGGKTSSRAFRDGFTGELNDSLTAMVDLQHKLFLICVPASLLLSEVVREACPRMTTSVPDQGLQDLWSYENAPIIRSAPATWPTDKDGKPVIDHSLDREKHLTPISKFKVDKKTADRNDLRLLVDLYKYQQFLKFGPHYDTELDALRGISSAPLTFEEAAGTVEIIWVPLG